MDPLQAFGMRRAPFAPAPDPALFFAAAAQRDALQRLRAVAQGMRGLAVVLGEVGRGKSALARRLLADLPAPVYAASLLVVLHAGVSARWLLQRLARQVGVESPSAAAPRAVEQVAARLAALAAAGQRCVLLIDEAQLLDRAALMRELRGLLNIEADGRKLVSIILFGLPQLADVLALDPPLLQRLAMRVELTGLSAAETAAYVHHRLQAVGGDPNLFAPAALAAVHARAGGIPRLVNILCDNALMALAARGGHTVPQALVEAEAAALGLSAPAAPPGYDVAGLDAL